MMTPLDLFHATQSNALRGFANVLHLDDGTDALDAYLSDDGQTLVIGFPGTEGAIWPPSKDWIENIKVWHRRSGSLQAMAGFVEAWDALKGHVAKLIGVYQPHAVRFAGFSQGGAIANLALVDLWLATRGSVTITLDTFGAPRVWDDQSAGKVWDILIHGSIDVNRWTVWGEPVAMLPPWIFGYQHVGTHRRIGPVKFLTTHSANNYSEALSHF